jgi:hypothetical protein
MLEHCVDWDMWKRIAVRKPMFYEPEPLACYRLHAAAESGRAIRAAENVVEERLSIDLSMFDIAPHKGRQIRRQARRLAGVRAACRARNAVIAKQLGGSSRKRHSAVWHHP